MKKLLLLFLMFISFGALAAEAGPVPYYIPPAQFGSTIQIMDRGFANIFGMFRNATGSFQFDESNKTISRLRIAIDATSVMSANAESQKDIASLLGVFQYPEISITAPDSIAFAEGRASLKATLTAHGTSKPVTLEATLNRMGKSPHGGGMWSSEGDALGLSIRTSFKRADFSMGGDDPNNPDRFGDTVTLMLEMQAIKQ